MSDVQRPVESTEDSRTWGEYVWQVSCQLYLHRWAFGPWISMNTHPTPAKRHCRACRSKDGVENLKPGFQHGGVERVKFHVLCAKLSHRAFISVNYRRKPSFDNPAFKTFPPLWLLSGIILPSPPPPRCALITRQHSLMSSILKFIWRHEESFSPWETMASVYSPGESAFTSSEPKTFSEL